MEHKKLWLVYLFVWMLPKNEQENMHTTNNGSRTWTKDSMDHQNQHQHHHHHQSKGKEVGKVSARFLGKEIIWWDTIKTQRTVCSAPEEGRERHKSNKGGRGPSLLLPDIRWVPPWPIFSFIFPYGSAFWTHWRPLPHSLLHVGSPPPTEIHMAMGDTEEIVYQLLKLN